MPTDLREQLHRNLANAYVVDREIGRGGMATVYLARDLKHQRQVALKVLDPELGALLGAERFLSEIRVTANLQHPNLLPLFDSGEAEGLLYYVMPFVEGESLRARLEREKQLPVDEAVRIAVAIANALDYAHAHGVIHRDLKPENILLQHGQPVVADFGIALAVANAGGSRVTQTGLSLGTPQYMSPEQATGDRVIDGRTDIYSLAAVTYELLAGEPPHSGTSAQAIIAKLMTTEPQPVRALRPSVPANVAMAVERGLAKLPADRFASSKEFADALTNPAFTTMTASAAMPARRSASRLVLPLVATSLVLLAAAVWGWLRPMPQAPLLRYDMALDSAEEIIAAGRYGRMALSPDGNAFVYVSRQRGQLMLRRRTDLHATPVAGAEAAGAPTFSPDGKRVAFIQSAATLMIASLDGSPPIAVTDSLFGLSGLTWGDDDVLYCDGRGLTPMVRVASRAHARPERFIALDSASGEFDQFYPDALPGVRAVLFTSQGRNSGARRATSIVAVEPRSGARHTIVENALRARYVSSGHLLYVTTDGTLMAAPFDVKTLTITGAAIVVGTGLSTETGTLDFASSNTGSVAYSTRGNAGGQRLAVWVGRDGKAQAIDSSWHGSFSEPALSPDGNRLAFTDGVPSATTSDIWIRNLSNGALSRLTVEGGANRFPVWSMDEKRVIYSWIGDDAGGLREKAADGSGTSTLLVRTQQAVVSTESPDRKWIVYSLGNGLQSRIYALRAGDSTGRRVIDDTEFGQRSPALSPDGKWLAYALNETSRGWQVFVSPFPNTASARWQVSRNGGAEPQWSRRGAELVYRDNAGMIVAVPVSTTPSFSVGKPQELFGTAQYIASRLAVAPDGNRMLFFQPLGGANERLTFVENWTRELDRQTATKR